MMVDGKTLEKLQQEFTMALQEIAELRQRIEELEKKSKWTESFTPEQITTLLSALTASDLKKHS